MEWIESDGGRVAAGFKGKTGDCVTRAIALATGVPYRQVYEELFRRNRLRAESYRGRKRKFTKGTSSPRLGVHREIFQAYLEGLGWEWVPTMKVGQGCKVHLCAEELPAGRLVVCVSRHVCAVIDGVVYDNHDPSRGGKRCVYGYFKISEAGVSETGA
jgi:hypothetical protein